MSSSCGPDGRGCRVFVMSRTPIVKGDCAKPEAVPTVGFNGRRAVCSSLFRPRLPSFGIKTFDLLRESALDRLPLELRRRGNKRGAYGPGLDREPDLARRRIFRKLGNRPANLGQRMSP